MTKKQEDKLGIKSRNTHRDMLDLQALPKTMKAKDRRDPGVSAGPNLTPRADPILTPLDD